MLAMVVNDDAGCLDPRGGLASIASMLAPTGFPADRKMVNTQSTLPEPACRRWRCVRQQACWMCRPHRWQASSNKNLW
jgi:hypothetical protein